MTFYDLNIIKKYFRNVYTFKNNRWFMDLQ